MQNTNENIDKVFINRCTPLLKRLDSVRQEKLRAYKLRKKLAIPIAAILTAVCGFIDYWLLMFQSGNDDGFVGVTIIALGALYTWVRKPKRQYTKAYKKDMLPHIAKCFGDFEYKIKGKINMDVLKPSKIIPGHNRYKSEDYFKGAYKGVNIEFSEIHLIYKSSGKNKSSTTKFKGLAIYLDMQSKNFLGHTVIAKDRALLKGKKGGMKRADLVDPEFEKIFDVYTTDQTEARYLIDPIMIENLKFLYEYYHGQDMSVAFYESKVLILIKSKHNHFEPSDIHIPATDIDSLLSMKLEIERILSIIDQLNLYDPNHSVDDNIRKAVDA